MDATETQKLLDDFAALSATEVEVTDARFHTRLYCCHDCMSFCSYIHRSQACLDLCTASDMEGFSRAQKLGDLYIYPCAFGILHAITPVREGNAVSGWLILTLGRRESTPAEAPLKAALDCAPELSADEIEARLKLMPVRTEREVNAYKTVLPMLAEHIGSKLLLSQEDGDVAGLVRRYIHENMGRKITLSDLAQRMHYSTVTLTEHFRHSYGMSIMEYLKRERMCRAEQLLRTGKFSVGEVAAACGFDDAEYFSRSFRLCYGMPPRMYITACLAGQIPEAEGHASQENDAESAKQ